LKPKKKIEKTLSHRLVLKEYLDKRQTETVAKPEHQQTHHYIIHKK
jgi:hypothetical protein